MVRMTEHKYVLLDVKIPQKMKEDLIRKAKREKTTISDVVRRALMLYLYVYDPEGPEPTIKVTRVKRVKV